MRDFKWCPQEGIKQCLMHVSRPHSHVCIRSVGATVTVPQCGKPALHLAFHDLEPDKIRVTGAFAKDPINEQKIIDECFTNDNAKAIVEFISGRPEDELIIVNCEAGVSRSPGVVLALRGFYGGDTNEVFDKAYPNMHVTNTLVDILKLSK